jgi:integrase
MKGSIHKPGRGYSSWGFSHDLGVDPASGKRRKKKKYGFRTRREAEKALRDSLIALDSGTYVEASKQTVATFLEEWLESRRPQLKDATIASYEDKVRLYLLPHIGEMRLQALDAGTIKALYAKLLDSGGVGGAQLSHRSVAYVHTILNAALKDALAWGRIVRNPAAVVSAPRASASGERRQHPAWSANQLRNFLDCARNADDGYYPLWHLVATTGLRRGEALGLRWSDIDLTEGRLSVVQTLGCVRHEPRISTPKTHRSTRPVALDAETVAVLSRRRKQQLEHKMLMGEGWQNSGDLVFTHQDGRLMHPERVSREFKRRQAQYGIDPQLNLHGLRHTWATLAMIAGVPPRVVQERMGHSDISTTLNIYSHVTPTMHEEAAETVAAAIHGLV